MRVQIVEEIRSGCLDGLGETNHNKSLQIYLAYWDSTAIHKLIESGLLNLIEPKFENMFKTVNTTIKLNSQHITSETKITAHAALNARYRVFNS